LRRNLTKVPPFFVRQPRCFSPLGIVKQSIHQNLVLHCGRVFVLEQPVGRNPSWNDATLGFGGVAESGDFDYFTEIQAQKYKKNV